MIDVYRRGRSGNLLEASGPVLCVNFGAAVVKAVFSGEWLTYRYMGLKRRYLPGFAPEDKFHVVPVGAELVDHGLKKNMNIYTDPGGDIFLELSEQAGMGRLFGDGHEYAIDEISDSPQGLLDRGIDTLVLPNLFAIEQERISRMQWGVSTVDLEWRRGR